MSGFLSRRLAPAALLALSALAPAHAGTRLPAAAGQETPAPAVRLLAQSTPAGGHAHAPAVGEYKLGALVIRAPWTRATPGGARVGGGFMTITNTGKEADRLIGGSAEIAGAFEVHEMKMDGGVMKMRALDKGLEIKPGETVELKPGGYHVMFLDLRKPIAEGAPLRGQLVFEKAGRIDVEYRIESRGAPAPAAGGHQHGASTP